MRTTTIANVRVGRADVAMDAPSHVRGVHEGNNPSLLRRDPGFRHVDGQIVATARRSTGINAKAREPIDPRMPHLSPA